MPPKMLAALVAKSKATAERVGADGTYARFMGSSCDRVAGASTSSNTRKAAAPPIPLGVTVAPAASARS